VASTAGRDGDVSPEARVIAARVRERAARAPQASQIAEMAMTPGAEMTPDEVRQLATDAVAQAAQVAFLLGQLAILLDAPDTPDDSAGGAGG
jgi:hypothetical protein